MQINSPTKKNTKTFLGLYNIQKASIKRAWIDKEGLHARNFLWKSTVQSLHKIYGKPFRYESINLSQSGLPKKGLSMFPHITNGMLVAKVTAGIRTNANAVSVNVT